MRKYLLFVFICLLPACLVAQNNHQMQQEDTLVSSKTPVDPILDELKAIHELQRQAKEGRDSIKDKMQKREKERQELPDVDMSNEYGAILQVENNTRQHWWYDDWNCFGIFTFIVAFASLIIGWITYNAQKKTEENTTKTDSSFLS